MTKQKEEIFRLTEREQRELTKANSAFMKLCRKYPKFKFIGNTVMNLYLLKDHKSDGFLHTDSGDQSKSLFAGGNGYCIYNNVFQCKEEQ
jgi:hypothetical protein